jgi:hypothetical protein
MQGVVIGVQLALPSRWRQAIAGDRRSSRPAAMVVATAAWGMATGHSLGASGGGVPTTVAPFNDTWSASVAITLLGAGLFDGVPIGWALKRRSSPLLPIRLLQHDTTCSRRCQEPSPAGGKRRSVLRSISS